MLGGFRWPADAHAPLGAALACAAAAACACKKPTWSAHGRGEALPTLENQLCDANEDRQSTGPEPEP